MSIKLSSRLPRHIAVVCKIPVEGNVLEAYDRALSRLQNTVTLLAKLNVPVMTFFLLHEGVSDSQTIDGMTRLFSQLSEWSFLHQNQVKTAVLGKWYGLPGRLVDSIKKTIELTKDFDRFFLNFCVNYNGQEEIVDACKLIARQVKLGKLDPESITKDTIKEQCYSSYFIPPDIILVTGKLLNIDGMLLWDSGYSHVHFAHKPLKEIEKEDVLKAIEEWQSS